MNMDYNKVVNYVRTFVSKNTVVPFSEDEILQIVKSIGTNYSGILAGDKDRLISLFISSINFDRSNMDEIGLKSDEEMYSVPVVFGRRLSAVSDMDTLMKDFYHSGRTVVSSDKTDRIYKVLEERQNVSTDMPSGLFRRGTTKEEIKDTVSRIGEITSENGELKEPSKHFNQDDISSLVTDEPISVRINRGIEKNRREIAEFLRERNEATRRKMYGEDYVEPSRHYGEKEINGLVSEVKESVSRKTTENHDGVQYYEVLKYVEWLLRRKSRYMFDTSLDIGNLADDIVKKLEIKYGKLYDGIYGELKYTEYKNVKDSDFSNFINTLIKKKISNSKDIKYKNEFLSVKKYVLDYILKSKRYNEIVDYKSFIGDVAIGITDELFESGRSVKDIKNGRFLSFIDNEIRKDIMCRKSCGKVSLLEGDMTRTSKEMREFKLSTSNFMRNKISRTVVGVGLGILIFSNTVPGVNFFDSIEETLFQSENLNMLDELKKFDNYKYPKISNADDKSFIETYSHLVHIFPEYAKYNKNVTDNYEQICLYRAYKSIDGTNPSIIDNILNIMRSNYQKTGDIDSEWLLSSNASFVDSSRMSYPVYVYIMLYEGGIDVSEYANAVKAYDLEGGINKISSQHQKDIKQMMQEYGVFMENLQNEFINLSVVNDKGVSK